ncbi:hypothetical protein ACVWYN_003088 [Pedobacter sp. UYP24]
MLKSLVNVLSKIFSDRFYKEHMGFFLILLLINLGPGSLKAVIELHKSLMLLFITNFLAMMIAFGVMMLYVLKCCHFVSGRIFMIHQQFLFYSMNSYTRPQKLAGWMIVQLKISFPVLFYALVSVGLAITHQYYLSAALIFVFITAITFLSAYYYSWLIDKSLEGSNQSVIMKLTRRFAKPLFSLFIYQVFDQLKLKYLLLKFLSYLLIIGLFMLLSDGKMDIRVTGIAMLAIAVAHCMLIFKEKQFEDSFLTLTRNLPFGNFQLFGSKFLMHAMLLIPEAVWLLWSLPSILAIGMLMLCLSIMSLLYSSLHLFGANQDGYAKFAFGIFIVSFFVIVYQLFWPLFLFNLVASYLIFHFNYYKFRSSVDVDPTSN